MGGVFGVNCFPHHILELSERSESWEQQSCPPSSFCGRRPREEEENGKRGWSYGGGEAKKESRTKLKIRLPSRMREVEESRERETKNSTK